MATARALRAGPGALRALRPGRSGEVAMAFGAGAYLRLNGGWVLLCGPRAPLGPLSLLVAGLGAAPAGPGAAARVTAGGGTLRVGRLAISLAPVPAHTPARPRPRRAGWETALDAALAAAPSPPDELAAGLADLAADRVADGVRRLAGRGAGLTPAGDDVLAGYAAWRRAESDPIGLDGAGCTPLGRAYLECAQRGELPAP